MKLFTLNIKFMIYYTIFLSVIIVLSSTNIFIIWISIELNLFSFILLLVNNSTTNEIEASINYFLFQALGSILFLTARIVLLNTYWLSKVSSILLIIAICLKLGIAPCHYWLPTTIEKIRWINCLILSTWQKIAPLFIIAYIIKPNFKLIGIIVCLNALTGRIIGLSQSNLKKIIAYSSITHIRWAIRGITINIPCLSIAYFILYRVISIPLFLTFYQLKIISIHEPWNKSKISLRSQISITIILLSLRGLPPLTGFIPKLLIISILIDHSKIITSILLSSSLLSLFFYLNVTLNIIRSSKTNNYTKKSKNILNFLSILTSTSLLGLIIIILK